MKPTSIRTTLINQKIHRIWVGVVGTECFGVCTHVHTSHVHQPHHKSVTSSYSRLMKSNSSLDQPIKKASHLYREKQ